MTTLALDAYLTDWLDLLLRWLHVIASMAWIGTSFYFVLLDQSLRDPRRREDVEAGVSGELWEVHGGGFYQVQKYRVAPRQLPDHLAWFKWEAYTTWLSGFALMTVLYYLNASGKLVDPGVADLDEWQAIGISVGLLVAAWIVYDVLNRFLSSRPVTLWVLIAMLTVVSAWGASELFAPRAAYLQVGAMLGTIMAANVFFVIIPAHRELIRAKEAGREPDPAPTVQAKIRSVHNNYLTLPVVLTMLAGHMPFAYGDERAWLVLVAFLLLGVWARVFFNLRHQGRTHWWMPVAGVAAVVALGWAIRPEDDPEVTPGSSERGRSVFVEAGCGSCHTLAAAGSTGTVGPNLDGAAPSYALVVDRVTNGQGSMPAFAGDLTEVQIEDVAAYVSAVAGQ